MGPFDEVDEVEVWSRYERTWVGGFELADVQTTDDGFEYLIRRRSDGVVLPERFGSRSVRRRDAD